MSLSSLEFLNLYSDFELSNERLTIEDMQSFKESWLSNTSVKFEKQFDDEITSEINFIEI